MFLVKAAAQKGDDQIFIEMPNFYMLVDAVFWDTSFG